MTGVGIIGCGNILAEYLTTLQGQPLVEVRALADLDVDRARAAGEPLGIPGMQVAELLARSDLQVVVNLTVPSAHASVSRQALEHGFHVYSEKPLALTRDDGLELLQLARRQGQQLCCGPDTFLGASFQLASELLAQGAIGQVTGASANFFGHGPEEWHPNPAFFYQHGAGPLFDMGPYYLTQLVKLLGPVAQVSGSARISQAERRPERGPHTGLSFPVDTPTTVNALLEFEAGPIASFSCSFDVWASSRPWLELHGTTGTLQLSDPNQFQGTLRLFSSQDRVWQELTAEQPHGVGRGSGVLDLARSISSGTQPSATGSVAFHVLDVMHCILDSASSGQRQATRPAA